ncbi:spore germination protein [Thermohalobacter berrensis]|uniref:Spore gernimation protein n=1 Tax=Thermohalobacter berrensis TaxID=99594 RepID=A0A419T0F9_9FIRM|nr:spore germination protein [Thermohalobacter berrensis]RKD30918.1 spore gernimation protein [Thermohalobacter berrensis]
MGLFKRFFKKDKKKKKEDKGKKGIKISSNYNKNINQIKNILKDCEDVIYREFTVGSEQNYNFAIIYIDGLIDKKLISDYVLESLMHQARELEPNPKIFKNKLYELCKKGNIAATEIKEAQTIDEAIDYILAGETILILENYPKILVISSRGWPVRGLQEPQTETVIRGPRDGFVETGKYNTTLIRRRIRDPKLKLKYMKLGVRSKTDVAIMYIEDIANKEMVEEVKRRLKDIKIDSVIESGYIEQYIQDNYYSPFPQVETTERPDAVAASLYEGRIAIVTDNTPFVLLVPATLTTFLQSSEDYYERWIITSLIRLLRYVAALIALLLPSLYIAITSYHPGMLPTELALYVAATRDGVPFPAFIEAFIMEATIELLREAGMRLSGPIGTTIGIVGGLVIGQAAVEAGIVSPLMIIIVAVTTISSFAIPNYSFATSFRIVRFAIMLSSAILGLYGIMLGLLLLGSHLVNLKSFGVPYLTPFVSTGITWMDLKDAFVTYPIPKANKRPKFTNVVDETRTDEENTIKAERGDEDDRGQ